MSFLRFHLQASRYWELVSHFKTPVTMSLTCFLIFVLTFSCSAFVCTASSCLSFVTELLIRCSTVAWWCVQASIFNTPTRQSFHQIQYLCNITEQVFLKWSKCLLLQKKMKIIAEMVKDSQQPAALMVWYYSSLRYLHYIADLVDVAPLWCSCVNTESETAATLTDSGHVDTVCESNVSSYFVLLAQVLWH